jgi:uncharacterized protein (TIGR01777 family)
MRVIVAGGTGFVGEPLCRALRGAGHSVVLVSRDPAHAGEGAIGWEEVGPAVGQSEAVVNLAGESITGRWSAQRKLRILDSRVSATRALVDAITATRRPTVLVNASAVGYYGPRGDEPLDETAEAGNGFLARVCQAWEAEAQRAENFACRVVRLRLGVVLAADGGALARMLPPFRAFLGGPVGSGKQWMSWIHRDDVTGMVVDALSNPRYQGAVNATAPQPVTNRTFVRTLGKVLARPAWLPVPAAVLRLALGEMADMLLTGQRVVPALAQQLGYRWRYADLSSALRASARR